MNAIEVSEKLTKHNEAVAPGQPFRLGEQHTIGDAVSQGDLIVEIVADVPGDYEPINNPTDADRQLVPESGQGSHHRLQSFDGAKLYRPKNWGRDPADLRGPCVVFDRPNAIVHEPGHDHPHGTVLIDAPMTVLCTYQRNLDSELREMRARD